MAEERENDREREKMGNSRAKQLSVPLWACPEIKFSPPPPLLLQWAGVWKELFFGGFLGVCCINGRGTTPG